MYRKRITLLADNDGIGDEIWRWRISFDVAKSGKILNAGYVNARQERAYYLRNTEITRQRGIVWRGNNKERTAATNAKRYAANREKADEVNRVWKAANPESVSRTNKKQEAKRKGMGFQPLNEWFEGSEGHHVNNDQVIYIPEGMHRRYHNLKTGKGMQRMNALAFQYLFKHPSENIQS